MVIATRAGNAEHTVDQNGTPRIVGHEMADGAAKFDFACPVFFDDRDRRHGVGGEAIAEVIAMVAIFAAGLVLPKVTRSIGKRCPLCLAISSAFARMN